MSQFYRKIGPKDEPMRRRKVSAQPPLEKVEEEFNSEEITKKLEIQIQAMHSSFQEIQKLFEKSKKHCL